MKISPVISPASIKLSPEIEKAAKGKAGAETSFGDMLSSKIGEVDNFQKVADQQAQEFATGKSRNLHEAVLAMEMADTSLRMLVTVRNKAIEAYQEIMKMPI